MRLELVFSSVLAIILLIAPVHGAVASNGIGGSKSTNLSIKKGKSKKGKSKKGKSKKEKSKKEKSRKGKSRKEKSRKGKSRKGKSREGKSREGKIRLPSPNPTPSPTPPEDTTPPTITLNGSNPQEIFRGDAYTDLGAIVSDNVDNPTTITGNGSVDTSVVGNYTVTYNAVDAAGNEAQPVTRSVVVLNDEIIQPEMVLVAAGVLPSGTSVEDFQIASYEVTLAEWKEVRDWAVENEYDLIGVVVSSRGNYPVAGVNWFDVIKWCNAKSEKEGKSPIYIINGEPYRSGTSIPEIDPEADGYRLPSEAEWEWAARGGDAGSGGTYSGSNTLDDVGWFKDNSSGASHPVGSKSSNEFGIFDMSGNVWEWVFDIYDPLDTSNLERRSTRGGSYSSLEGSCAVATRSYLDYSERQENRGFRLVLPITP